MSTTIVKFGPDAAIPLDVQESYARLITFQHKSGRVSDEQLTCLYTQGYLTQKQYCEIRQEEETPERRDEDKPQEGQDNGEGEPESEPQEVQA